MYSTKGFHLALLSLLLATACGNEPRTWTFQHQVLENFHPLPGGHSGESAIADINGDGAADIWFSADNGREDLYQMGWYANPTWTLHRIARGDMVGGNWIDLDNDGDADLVTGKAYRSMEYVWFENTGQAEQADWPEHPISTGRINADLTRFADLNRDGRDDIVVLTFRRDVFYLPVSSNPRQQEWTVYHLAHSENPRTGGSVGDVDNDNDIDVVWGRGWLENPGDAAKTPWKDHIIDPDWHHDAQSQVADLDRDGRSDIVLASEESDHGLAWYSRSGNETNWIKHVVADSGYEGVHSLQLADFDLDGDLDIFCAEMHQSGYIESRPPHKIAVFENVDIGRNLWREHIVAATGSHNARAGDLNGDGYPDIVGSNWNNRLPDYPMVPEVWFNQIGVSSSERRSSIANDP